MRLWPDKRKSIVLCLAALCVCVPVLAQTAAGGYFSNDVSFWDTLTSFFQFERGQSREIRADPADLIIIHAINFFIALACFALAVLVASKPKIFAWKRYLWFLMAFNVGWFVCLLCYRFSWLLLEFFLLKLAPDLRNSVINFLSASVLVSAAGMYVWLFARTFSMSFWGSVLFTILFHGLYFTAVWLVIIFSPANNKYTSLIRANFGAQATVRSYLSDVDKISNLGDALSYLRARPFHL